MQKQCKTGSPREKGLVTRRTALGGLVTALVTPILSGESASAKAAPAARTDPASSPPSAAQDASPRSAAPIARAFHTVTALPDGCLLVVGGVGSGNRALS